MITPTGLETELPVKGHGTTVNWDFALTPRRRTLLSNGGQHTLSAMARSFGLGPQVICEPHWTAPAKPPRGVLLAGAKHLSLLNAVEPPFPHRTGRGHEILDREEVGNGSAQVHSSPRGANGALAATVCAQLRTIALS